ncbi:MAG TPA: monovalent cation:proton antiporter-2 (CPA2) family protein [Gammaproteobacteria bacterium]|nr:monovalent cation:proton antiporter-2 (CPA2) family protein [Gammaproteobacteria bacterium]
MENNFLFNVFVFLAATCIVVPLAGSLRLGSVLGYLVAGVLIGPFGMSLISNGEHILRFAQFGVVMMLFIIGLELDPFALWRLRKSILGLGGLQLVVTTLAFSALGMALGFDWHVSVACGLTLSLSSTALVLQLLQEKGLLHTAAGEASFSVLLLQDMAVIPILIIFPLLAPQGVAVSAQNPGFLTELPAWAHALMIAGVVAIIIFGGRYVSRHILRYIAKTNLRELFTAVSLALVVGITLLMNAVGVSPALGAFLAGVVLAKSEYRHSLETDIQPFKGLLLGLFFISVGMGMNFGLLVHNPVYVLTAVVLLIVVKAVILFILGSFFSLNGSQRILFGLALAQGGEFAFVLLQFASGLQILHLDQAAFLTLVVALSMAVTPFLMIFNERYIVPRFMSKLPVREYDRIQESDNPVIIAGYGRFGQIIGRFLRAQGVGFTILEKDPDQVELVRRYGNRGYFGDASRMDLLDSAGARKAKLLIVAVDNANEALEIVRLTRETFPGLTIFARARNRRHAYELQKAGADLFRRELFDSSLWMGQEVMKFLGQSAEETANKAQRFMQHDEQTLKTSFEFFENEPELTEFAKQATDELERIMQNDINDINEEKK